MNASIIISFWRHQYLRAVRAGSAAGLLLRIGFVTLSLLTVAGIVWTSVVVLPHLDAMTAIQRAVGGFMRDYLVVVAMALFAGNLWLSSSSPFDAAAYRYLPISILSVALMVQAARLMNARYATLGGGLTWLQFVVAGEGHWGHVAVAATVVVILDAASIIVSSSRRQRGAAAFAPGIIFAVIIVLDMITEHALSGRAYEWLFAVDSPVRDVPIRMAAIGGLLVWFANGVIQNDLRYAT
ncbi:MAG: hypothetical protein WD423_09510 [Rhodothermales bacterium]